MGAKATELDRKTESANKAMRTIVVSREASIDLDQYSEYIAQSNTDAALDFFDAARSTFVMLAKMPFMGKRYAPNNPRLENLRQWRIRQFTSYLIFYRVTEESIEVVRILNAAQDIDRILEDETD